MSTTQELHNKLKQHADNLQSGKAFSNPKSLFNRFHAWHAKRHVVTKTLFLILPFLAAPVFLVHLYHTGNFNIFEFFSLFLAINSVPITILNISLHKGGMEEAVAKKLSDTLRLHPSLKDTITTISQYISHPDVTNDWWSDVINTLNQIIDAKPTNNATEVSVLQEMIEKDSQQDVLVSVELDEREKELAYNHQHKSQRETQ